MYDPKEDNWLELVPLEREITNRRVSVNRGCLLAVDGFLLLLDDDISKYHQLFNPVSHTMTNLMQSHGRHWFAGWALLNGQLMCVGGIEDMHSGVTDMVHAWDMSVPLTRQDVSSSGEQEGTPKQGWRMLPPFPFAIGHLTCLNMHVSLSRLDSAASL